MEIYIEVDFECGYVCMYVYVCMYDDGVMLCMLMGMSSGQDGWALALPSDWTGWFFSPNQLILSGFDVAK